MVTLQNAYTSDIQDLLDWWKANKEGIIPGDLHTRVGNLMLRLEKDLHNIKIGKS